MKGPLTRTDEGLYCPAGGFYIDPECPVSRAVITHAHGDHAKRGTDHYLCATQGEAVLRHRMNAGGSIQTLAYGETLSIGGVRVSLHPAGHIRGSAQVRLERDGEVCVVTGDYKGQRDPTCASFEPLTCDTLITECTFGLPIYRWPEPEHVFDEINQWWETNQENGVASVLFGYSLGKAQRLLAGVDASIGPIFTHGAVEKMTDVYRKDGISLPPTTYVSDETAPENWDECLIVAPSSAGGSPWMKRFTPFSAGFASGWMRIRGNKRRRSLDRGFVLSDHADWPQLNQVIQQSGAQKIYATYGNNDSFARWLREEGYDAEALPLHNLG